MLRDPLALKGACCIAWRWAAGEPEQRVSQLLQHGRATSKVREPTRRKSSYVAFRVWQRRLEAAQRDAEGRAADAAAEAVAARDGVARLQTDLAALRKERTQLRQVMRV